MPKPKKRPPPNPPRGFERYVARLEPAQIAVLHKEAERRARERGLRQLDVSEIIREAVAAWIAKPRR